ncbi:hypothetical protein, partial [Cytobacillus gottheilii]|uniref:hypothetical protein n=1 Tax=Cytobacillus gottheilii TaxID=859144 RepID=UPI001C5A2A5F
NEQKLISAPGARFPRVGAEPPRHLRSCGVSPIPLLPQESRTFCSNQRVFYPIENLSKNNKLLEKSLF